MDKLLKLLFKPISASVVAAFRILFGSLLFLECLYYWRIGFVPFGLTRPVFHLKYDYFEWVDPLPEPVMYGILALMTLCALLIAAGIFYRWAVGFFGISFIYFILIEQSHYNNHFYLFALLLIVLFFIPADVKYAVKPRKTELAGKIYWWHQYLLTFLVFITYFYGGIAKTSGEWISGRLPRAIVEGLPATNGLKNAMGVEGFTSFLQWGGVLFDLSIGFLLLWKPTRWFAVIGVLIFNFTNGSILFDDIGNFPLFMVLATILFFEPDFVEKLIPKTQEKRVKAKKGKKIRAKTKSTETAGTELILTGKNRLTAVILGIFVMVQLLLPLRSYVMKDIPEWVGENMRFSWRMKMQSKKNEKVELKFVDVVTKEELVLPIRGYLTGHQLLHLTEDPNYLVQLAKFMKNAHTGADLTNVVVRADIQTSFNGRPVQTMVNPMVNLLEIDPREGNTSWIVPLK